MSSEDNDFVYVALFTEDGFERLRKCYTKTEADAFIDGVGEGSSYYGGSAFGYIVPFSKLYREDACGSFGKEEILKAEKAYESRSK